MNARRSLAGAAAAAVAVVLAGCGSTVATSGGGTTAVGGPGSLSGPLGAGTPQASAGVTAPGTAVGPGSVSTGPAGGTSAPGTGPGGSAPGPGGGGPVVAGGASGPGITPTTIYVGEVYEPDTATADKAIGAAQANPGDTKAETIAVINYVNAHGGVAHRKIVPIWYKASLSDSANGSAQQACSLWTEDHKVFVLNGGDFRGGSQIMDQCTANARGIEINGGEVTLETTAMQARYPADIDLNGLANDRAMRYTVEGLSRLHYFGSGAKVGIATWDDAYYKYGITHAALPALARLGLRNVPVEYISSPASYGDLSATSASVSSAVLKFNHTVDHVILFDGASGVAGGGVLTLEWMQQAHSQHYNPRYGLNSGGGFNALGSALPADQLANSVGVGWEPALEQTSTDFAAGKQSAQAQLCRQIMNRAGQQVSGANAIAIQYAICDAYFFLKRALDTVSGPVNQQSAIAAINAIGTSYRSLVNFGAAVSAQRHDLPYLVRNMTYQGSCSCFRYVGAVYAPAG